MRTIALLTISNVFMTLAWYGHLKYKDSRLLCVFRPVPSRTAGMELRSGL